MEDLPPLPEVEDDPSHKWFSDEDEYDENKYSVCAVPGLLLWKQKIKLNVQQSLVFFLTE